MLAEIKWFFFVITGAKRCGTEVYYTTILCYVPTECLGAGADILHNRYTNNAVFIFVYSVWWIQ